MNNCLWLSSEHTDVDLGEMKPIFGIADKELPMPSCVVPGDLMLDDVHILLAARLRDGVVALGYGTYWVIWFEDVLDSIVDMHGGCLQLRDGEWVLIGGS